MAMDQAAAARPTVTVYNLEGKATESNLAVPDVLLAPIRSDLVRFVHTNMNKNARQPYAVKCKFGPKGIVAGHDLSARSWGTGRAVSRVPRVRGGGTHRAGQGAFANICRGGRMFAPTKVWRRWHRKINKNVKRYAVSSAVAASAVPALVMARGHRIQNVEEIPLIVDQDFELLTKTKAAQGALQALHLSSELRRCKKRYKRAGKGKMRNRRWRNRLGPLIVYKQDGGVVKAVRNLRGVDVCRVDQLNLLKLAPGGHLGRLVIWTAPAFAELDNVFGTRSEASVQKRGYHMPRPLITNSDLSSVVNSVAIQSEIREKKQRQRVLKKRNPLKKPQLYAKLNPAFAEDLQELMKEYKNPKVRTTTLLKPLRKKQRVKVEVSEEDKKAMYKYWDMVIGERPFKNREELLLERVAVSKAIKEASNEKRGLDLLELLNAADAEQQE